MVIFSAIPLPLIQLTSHLLVTAWRRWKKHSAQRIHLSRRFKAAVKNIASARDFTQTQTTKEAAARDRGGSPHQWFSSPHLFYPEASHGSREGPWFNSQKGQRSTSQHRDGRCSSVTGVRVEEREQDWPLWHPQASGTFRYLIQCPPSSAWQHLAGVREWAPEGLCASCVLSNTTPSPQK